MSRVASFLNKLLKQTATPVTVDNILDTIAANVAALAHVGEDHTSLAKAYEAAAQDSLKLAQSNRLEAARAQEAVAKLEDVVNFA